jgi:DNA-directed RNA polymerase specialized sigma24 family protein
MDWWLLPSSDGRGKRIVTRKRESTVDRGTEDFAAFYERHRDPCFRAVLAAVADRHLAEELTAEAFARAWGHWRKVAGRPAPAAWASSALRIPR